MTAVPLFATGSIKSGRGPGSLRVSNLAGSLFVPGPEKASLLFDPPLGVVSRQPSRTAFDSPSGSLPKTDPASPISGRRPVGPFRRRHSRSLQTTNPRGLFFPLEAPEPVTRSDRPLFAGAADSPIGTA